ncbi:hypothetical protein EPR50_G00145320 [Perca flavescens]|uniref:Ig-like domain-containing protein n=1 Tax=Perca flavescens TaxID=8167 RepID=A0A484CJ11_PERFV|nr:hypothetical protein EPR50_G00145320 [Perca flavescens]
MMMSLILLLATLGLLVQGSSGEIILTQSPGSQSVAPGQSVSIRCKASSSAGTCLNWEPQGAAPAVFAVLPQHPGLLLSSQLLLLLLPSTFQARLQSEGKPLLARHMSVAFPAAAPSLEGQHSQGGTDIT